MTKPFREQLQECVANGNHIIVTEPEDFYFILIGILTAIGNKNTCHISDHNSESLSPIFKLNSISICVKYKRICASNVCLEERKNFKSKI